MRVGGVCFRLGVGIRQEQRTLIADTVRGAIWRVDLDARGDVKTPTGCDTTYAPDTICLEALFVQHPALDGADGIVLDQAGNIIVDANERNEVAIVDRNGGVSELFRNPADASNLRNAGPLEFPTSPILNGKRFCTTSSDGNRRDNAPNTAGEASPGTAVLGKVSCLDQPLNGPGG